MRNPSVSPASPVISSAQCTGRKASGRGARGARTFHLSLSLSLSVWATSFSVCNVKPIRRFAPLAQTDAAAADAEASPVGSWSL